MTDSINFWTNKKAYQDPREKLLINVRFLHSNVAPKLASDFILIGAKSKAGNIYDFKPFKNVILSRNDWNRDGEISAIPIANAKLENIRKFFKFADLQIFWAGEHNALAVLFIES